MYMNPGRGISRIAANPSSRKTLQEAVCASNVSQILKARCDRLLCPPRLVLQALADPSIQRCGVYCGPFKMRRA